MVIEERAEGDLVDENMHQSVRILPHLTIIMVTMMMVAMMTIMSSTIIMKEDDYFALHALS